MQNDDDFWDTTHGKLIDFSARLVGTWLTILILIMVAHRLPMSAAQSVFFVTVMGLASAAQIAIVETFFYSARIGCRVVILVWWLYTAAFGPPLVSTGDAPPRGMHWVTYGNQVDLVDDAH